MAVARVSSAESVRTLTTDPWTFAFNPAGTPRGIVLAVVHGVTATRHAQTATYGGVPLALIVEAADTSTEPGNASLWFLGAGIPTGQQTVSVDLDTGTGDDIHFVVWELSGLADLEVIDSDELNENAANPVVTLQSAGRVKLCIAAMYGGGAAPGGTLATGNLGDHTHDLGAFYSQTCYEETVDNADHTIGWGTLGSDDLAFVAIAVSEKQPITGTLEVIGTPDTVAASGTFTPPTITGTVSVTAAADTVVASGVYTPATISGTLALTGATDTLAGEGSATPPDITGTIEVTDRPDTATAEGTVAAGDTITGTVAVSETSDHPDFHGKTRRPLARAECCAHHGLPGHVCVTRNPEPLFD